MCEQCEPRVCVCKTAPSREDAMVVVRRGNDGIPTVWCDPCIVDIVSALNASGIPTVWSCCGHGEQDGRIGLTDGRELVIPVPDSQKTGRYSETR